MARPPIPIEEAIEEEFTCYWHGDELPYFSEAFKTETLPTWAAHAASRLRQAVGQPQVEQLRAFLDLLAHDPDHPLFNRIENFSLIGWTDPEMWPNFLMVLGLIRASL